MDREPVSEGTTIFDLVQDRRSPRIRFWCFFAGTLLNLLFIALLAIVSEFYAASDAANRLIRRHRRGIQDALLVMIIPKLPSAAVLRQPSQIARTQIRTVRPKPLEKPDPRILNRLEPELLEFVKENPAIESIVTRELVRDLDSRVLDVQRLLKKSSIEVSFEIDDQGKIVRDRIDKSSRVPSIDHLALEAIRLLEKYHFFTSMKGLRRIYLSIRIGDKIDIVLTGKAEDDLAAEEVKKQLQNAVTILRFALTKEASEVLLSDVRLAANEREVVLSKSLEKDSLVNLILRYYRSEPQPTNPASAPRPRENPPHLLQDSCVAWFQSLPSLEERSSHEHNESIMCLAGLETRKAR